MTTISYNKKKTPSTETNAASKVPLFRMSNYVLMGVGVLILCIGFLCMRGGAVSDPNTFDGEIFNTRRIVVAPILMFIGLALEVVAIMWHPRAKQTTDPAESKNS